MSHSTNRSINRRRWLQQAGAALTGVALGTTASFSRPAGATPAAAPAASFHPRQVQGRVPPQGAVLLDSNENPHGPSPKARDVAMDAFNDAFRYPGDAYRTLVQAIAEREQVPPDHVLIGNGSTDVLCMAGAAYGLHGGEIVTGDPSYKGVSAYAEAVGGYVNPVPLTDDLTLDLEAMDRRTTASTSLVFVCNPNNPTGTIVDPADLQAFCETVSRRAVVFLDEAYIDFVDAAQRIAAVDLVRAGENVIVSRTFSKLFGMAGLRVGYGIARPDIVERLRGYSMGFPNTVGLRAAAASLDDDAFQKKSRRAIADARQYTTETLDEMGLEYAESHASFLFFRTGRDIQTVQREMAAQGVEVGRPFPPYTEWCRVSMGTMADMEAFASALQTVFA